MKGWQKSWQKVAVSFVGRAAVVAAAIVVVQVIGAPAYAADIGSNFWFDDFSDLNATAGLPPIWTPHPGIPGGNYNASSGDYVLTTTTPGNQDESLASFVEPFANPGLSAFTDMSIRTRAVLGAAKGNTLLGARIDFSTLSGYLVNIDHGGQLTLLEISGGVQTAQIAQYDPPGDGPAFIDSATDVVIQLDVFGNTVEGSFWRPGDPQPAPFLSGTSSSFAAGTGGVVYNEDDVDPPDTGSSSGIFRHVKAASIRLLDGDMDLDGDQDFDDIAGFVQGLTDPAAYELATGLPSKMMGDTDNDGDQDFDDIPVFVAILQGGLTAAQVPEPSTVALAVLGLVGLLAAVGRRRV